MANFDHEYRLDEDKVGVSKFGEHIVSVDMRGDDPELWEVEVAGERTFSFSGHSGDAKRFAAFCLNVIILVCRKYKGDLVGDKPLLVWFRDLLNEEIKRQEESDDNRLST